jgi:hypothetical protein
VSPNPDGVNPADSKYAPMSGRLPPYVATPRGIASPPLTGVAHTSTRLTPVPEAVFTSTAQPPTANDDDHTVASCAGMSRLICVFERMPTWTLRV